MVYRIKFRVYALKSTQKFVFTWDEGTALLLDSFFQPTVHAESAFYQLVIVDGKTSVDCLQDGALWNNAAAPSGPIELLPGALLHSGGKTIEILECPVARPDSNESTKFLDLSSLRSPVPSVESAEVALSKPTIGVPLPNSQEHKNIEVAPPRVNKNSSMTNFVGSAAVAAVAAFGVFYFVHRNSSEPTTTEAVATIEETQAAPPVVEASAIPVATSEPIPTPVAASEQIPQPPSRSLASVPTAEVVESAKPNPEKVADFLKAIEEGNLAHVKDAVEKDNISPDFVVDTLGRTPLVRAAAFGKLTILRYLQDKKASLSAIDFAGNNALLWAAINGHEKTFVYLMDQGLDPKAKREDGADAYAIAKQYHQKEIRNLLLAREKSKRAPASNR